MSTKKKLRRRRQTQEKEKRGGINPAVAFIVFVGLAIAAVVLIGYLLGGGGPEPPFPGAVWSPEHGHWH